MRWPRKSVLSMLNATARTSTSMRARFAALMMTYKSSRGVWVITPERLYLEDMKSNWPTKPRTEVITSEAVSLVRAAVSSL